MAGGSLERRLARLHVYSFLAIITNKNAIANVLECEAETLKLNSYSFIST